MTRPDTISPNEYALIKNVLTPAELNTWKLRQAGYSHRRISRVLGRSRTTIRDQLDRADHKIQLAKENAA